MSTSCNPRGDYTFTRQEVSGWGDRTDLGIEAALRRLIRKGRIVRPRRGFLVIVPPEHRSTGSPPASWFLDDLMSHIDQAYYVGLLSAARLHGAAHQQPMVFQVVTDRPTRPIHVGEVRIEFHMSSRVHATPVVRIQTETGTMRVSTAEATAFDLVRYPGASGHLSNVATVLTELAEAIDVGSLVQVAQTVRPPDVQRLGYLLDRIGAARLADPLADGLSGRTHRAILLRTGRPRGEAVLDRRWKIIPNEPIEVDL